MIEASYIILFGSLTTLIFLTVASTTIYDLRSRIAAEADEYPDIGKDDVV